MCKRICKAIVLGGILTGLCFFAGCGKTDQQTTTQDKSSQEKQELLWGRQGNTTKQCIYDYCLDEGNEEGYTWEESSIIQRDRQGKVVSTHSIEEEEEWGEGYLLGVSQKHLCYAVGAVGDDNYAIYVVPIEQKHGSELLLWEQQEKIAQTNELAVYIAEPYLIYTKGKYLYRYNFESKKVDQILEGKQQIYIESGHCTFARDGMLYVNDGKRTEDWTMRDNSVYRVDIEKGLAEQVYAATGENHANLVGVSGNLLYIQQKNQQDGSVYIECYDSEKQETKSIVYKKQLRQFLEDEKLIHPGQDVDTVDLVEVFFSEDCIYFHMQISYDYKKEKKYTDMDSSVVVRAPLEKLTELSNETVLNEWLFDHTAENWIEQGFTLCGDEVYLYFDESTGEGDSCMVGYDIKNKAIREIPETEPIYQQFTILLSDITALGHVCE